jgi:hypothetical protein
LCPPRGSFSVLHYVSSRTYRVLSFCCFFPLLVFRFSSRDRTLSVFGSGPERIDAVRYFRSWQLKTLCKCFAISGTNVPFSGKCQEVQCLTLSGSFHLTHPRWCIIDQIR